MHHPRKPDFICTIDLGRENTLSICVSFTQSVSQTSLRTYLHVRFYWQPIDRPATPFPFLSHSLLRNSFNFNFLYFSRSFFSLLTSFFQFFFLYSTLILKLRNFMNIQVVRKHQLVFLFYSNSPRKQVTSLNFPCFSYFPHFSLNAPL